MDRPDEPERAALTVPLEAVGSWSPRRARLAVAIWTIGLAGIAWIGLAAHGGGAAVAVAPITAVAPVTAAPSTARVAVQPELAHGPSVNAAPSVVVHTTLGEDGLINRRLAVDHVLPMSQADLERDGYRFYQELAARESSIGRHLPR